MRLIDADALYAALMEESAVIARGTGRNCLALACKAMADIVQDAPTIDAIPVIRCRDCKYFTPGRERDSWGMCTVTQSTTPQYSSCFDVEGRDEDNENNETD